MKVLKFGGSSVGKPERIKQIIEILKTYQAMKRNFNPTLEIEGAVLTMYDKRCDQTHNIEAELR